MTPRVSYWEEKEVRIVIFWGSGATLGRPSARALRHTGAGGCGADTLLAFCEDSFISFMLISVQQRNLL